MVTLRVFPRRTNLTPDDKYAIVGEPVDNLPEFDKVNISVTFSYDVDEGYRLCRLYKKEFSKPVKIGGPAIGTVGGEFRAGRYLKKGAVITSRGGGFKGAGADLRL